jgi:hypothetical protein
VNYNPVLDVALVAYFNGLDLAITVGFICPYNRAGANENFGAYTHITDHLGRRVYIRCWIYLR